MSFSGGTLLKNPTRSSLRNAMSSCSGVVVKYWWTWSHKAGVVRCPRDCDQEMGMIFSRMDAVAARSVAMVVPLYDMMVRPEL